MHKNWYYETISKKDKKHMREFLKVFGIGVRFNKHSGWADKNGTVAVFTDCSISESWSCVFHELCHVLAARDGKFIAYHLKYDVWRRKNHIAIRRTGWNAEQYVDKWAEKLMGVYLPDIPYDTSYRNKKDRERYHKWVRKNFPL